MDGRPQNFPELPRVPEGMDAWSTNVTAAHEILAGAYNRASELLRQEDGDPLRLRLHSERMFNRMVPILQALDPEVFNPEWIVECAEALASITVELEATAFSRDGIEHTRLVQVVPIRDLYTGLRGRPKKVFNSAWLQDALSGRRKISLKALAEALGIHPLTLRRHLQLHGVYHRFSEISDQDLDILIRHYKREKPSSGLRYVIGFLKRHGLRVQKRRVRMSLRRIDGLGQVLRNHAAIDRREYKVPRPNALWHTDGHHKLIHWGIVIHGFIDGYSRMIVGLKASNNNRAESVLQLFLQAINKHGTPSRMRGDRGGENIQVAVWMIKYRGANRASFMWGSSTRNTRIERLWVEVGSQFARQWRAFFTRLERLHQLDRKDPTHLWLIHHLFLDDINSDCHEFQEEWNHHPISRAAHDQTPSDMQFLGELTEGKYPDAFDNVQPDVLQRYYGAGHEAPDNANNDPGLDDMIADDQNVHIRHEAIDVPDHRNPFESEEAEDVFRRVLQDPDTQNIIPVGFGVAEDEWDNGLYPKSEAIKVGRKLQEIPLIFDIWWPRAVAWSRALETMARIQIAEE